MSRRKRDTPWIVAENTLTGGYLCRCLRCGVTEQIPTPTLVEAFVLRTKAFIVDHEDCPATPTDAGGKG